MKKLLIFLGFLLVSVAVEAQPTEKDGYRPMLKEGKIWNLMAYEYISGFDYEKGEGYEKRKSYPVVAALHGDTLINGNRYLKLYYTGDEEKYYHSAWREEERKVYTVREGGAEEILVFDFGMEINAISRFESAEELQLTKTDFVNVNGELFFRQSFTSTIDYGIKDETPDIMAVEGVGSNSDGIFSCGLFATLVGGIKEDDPSYYESSTLDFLSCEEDGEVIFTKDDFDREAYVEPESIAGYHPFVKEGKAWNYKEYEYEMILDEEVSFPGNEVYFRGAIKEIRDFCLVFSGDTIVGGHHCKKLYRKDISVEHSVPSYLSAWYEEGRKVYCIEKGSVTPKVLYDFSASLGEKLNVFTGVSVFLSNEDLVEVNGKTFLRQYIGTENDDIENKEYMLKCVSGVGTFMGVEYGCGEFATLVCPYGKDDNITTDFISCEEDGEVIFTKDDFNKEPFTDGIHSVEVNVPLLKHGKTYDLQGREVTAPQPGHIYIKDGRKFMAK